MPAAVSRKLEIALELAIAAVALLAVAISGLGTAILTHTIGLPFLVASGYSDRLPPLSAGADAVRDSLRPFVLAGILAVMAALGGFTLRFGERERHRWVWHWRPNSRRQRWLAVALAIVLALLLEAMFLVGTGYGPSDPRHDFRWEVLWSGTAQVEVAIVAAGVVLGRRVWRRWRPGASAHASTSDPYGTK